MPDRPAAPESSEPVFVMRCRVCGHEVQERWGPETHSLARAALIEHVNGHTDVEIRHWAMPLIVGREAAS